MLTADEHPGVFMFMVGMIILVLVGVGLSLVMDRRLASSAGAGEIQREIAANASELSELKYRHDGRSRQLADSGAKLKAGSMTRDGVLARLATLRQSQTAMEENRRHLRDTIVTLEGNFARYRADYRRKTWAGAVGEELGDFTVRGGRQYRQAAIVRVTDVGLEIRHEHGIARIQAPELDPKWQDRFQWNDEQRRTRLKAELDHWNGDAVGGDPGSLEGKKAVAAALPLPPVRESNRSPQRNADPTGDELKELHRQVIGWQAKISKLSGDQMEASSRAAYGGQSSVPGSLETWQARAVRLGNELARARAALEIARSGLVMVAPNDPLLVKPDSDR